MGAFLFLIVALAPVGLILRLLARRNRARGVANILPALSLILYALPYEGVLIAARFWQVNAAAASGILVLGVPLERLMLDGMAILLASLMAQWLWGVGSARQ